MPLLTIVSPYYQGSVTDEEFIRMVESVKPQINADVEWLIYHDGPLLRDLPLPREQIPGLVRETAERANIWGHNLRQLGILEAQGEYIIHANMDNLFYPGYLTKLTDYIRSTSKAEAYVSPLRMKNLIVIRQGNTFHFGKNGPDSYILYPHPEPNCIDAMQLILKRDTWLRYGGWYDRSMNSDGVMYPRILKEVEYMIYPEIMGEHW